MSDPLIELELSSSSKEKRLRCLKSLLTSDTIDPKLIEILTLVENVPPTISDYRERERHLETLMKTLRNSDSCQSERIQKFVFRHLLGILYINFEKFWGPTLRVILELLSESKFQKQLLKTLLHHLKETNNIIYNGSEEPQSSEDRPDHVLHRNFLFQLMVKFVHHIENDSSIFMEEFFVFVSREMLVSPFIEKFTKVNLKKSTTPSDETPMDLDQQPVKPIDQKRKTKKIPIPAAVLYKRKSRETFITATKVIQSFKNVKDIHREAELRELILDLLCCRDSSVQKAAFNCLLAYEDKHLVPYSDKIMKLINDRLVRTEMDLFSLDSEESGHILDDDRTHLMPILMRVLFGKMVGKIGKNTTGHDKADLRKTFVMRFVSGCSTSEILYFFELMFDPLFKFINLPYSQLENSIVESLDLEKYVPLNKLHAMLSSLNVYMESVAHLNQETLSHVLKLVIAITIHVIQPLENTDLNSQITEKNIDTLKALKRNCLSTSSQFFNGFPYYKYQQDELNLVFKHLVWTSTRGFIDKNYANSTPLSKLIQVFANNRIYHPLLVKRNKFDTEEYLLNHMISLYTHVKTQRPILKLTASMLANIIEPDRSFEGETSATQDTEKEMLLSDEDAIIPAYDKKFYKSQTNLDYNLQILMKFIPSIFQRLTLSCQNFIDKKDSDFRIENDELLILSRLSVFIKDPKQSILVVRLLLSTLGIQKNGDIIINTLKTAQNLINQVEKIDDPVIIDIVSDVLGYQRNVEQRNEICNLLNCMSQVENRLKRCSEIIFLLNATSTEFIDSPDLVKWNEGFKAAFKFIDDLEQDSINQPKVIQDPLNLILHQVGFIMNNVDRYEFSIRENCMIFFDKLSRKLKDVDVSRNEPLISKLLGQVLLDKFIKKGLRETNDAIKHTYIGVLRSLAMYCHEKNRTLREFHLFCNENHDIDFWENIRHIQLHQRSKALARLIADEKINQVSPKTLSSYFMPLAGGFLFSKTYKTVSSLSDNSIKLIGIICKHLNWVTYESTLNYYLGLLTKANATYQRTNIRLITEILKNFNFDITACPEAMSLAEENAKLEKRMKKRQGADDGEHHEVIATTAPIGKRLSPSTARMVYSSLTNKIIPKLNSTLHEMTSVELQHDKNMSNYIPEKEEIKRIPMAYAIVQLLNLLPGRYVLYRDNLPTLFLKLSSFLKSKNEPVRKASRATLTKVMNFVGPAYIPDLLRILKQNLDKGFQIHVLNYTIHSILDKMPLYYGSLDHSINELVNLCFQEIFGKLSEDKEIAKVLAKTYEAKKTKSYDTLLILASHISTEKLGYLMNSINEVSKTSADSKKVNKLSLCIQKVFNGLAKNDKFPLDKLFDFIQSTIEESIPNLKIRQKVEQPEHKSTGSQLREDRYLITKDLPRDRIKSKLNERGNSHILVDNSLRLLLHTFEANKALIKRKETHKRKLNGFIQLLSTCLKSSSPKCVMRALKCIHFIAQTKADLPAFETKCNKIIKKIFVLLSLYNGVGMVQGENFEMIGMCFKTLTLLLLKCKKVQLNSDQIRALLVYIEQDLHDANRQATAFRVLFSLLKKGCQSPELEDILAKVGDLLVTSDDENIRSLSMKIWQIYLLDYQHEKNLLQIYLTKFLRQLDYEYIDGRKSVLAMLTTVVTKFPEKILREYFELMFHLLAQRTTNEESKEVRGIVSRLIGLLLQRLPDQQTFFLTKFIMRWASNSSLELQLLGVKLLSIYIESCKSVLVNDRDKISKIVSIISNSLKDHTKPEAEVKRHEGTKEELKENEDIQQDVRLVRVEDKLNYHALRLFKRVIDKGLISCTETRNIGDLKTIWQTIASQKLSHWYLPVVLTSCELYMTFMTTMDLASALNVKQPSTDNYLEWNAKRIVRTLCDKYLDLLDRVDESNQLLAYLTESLIHLGKVIANSQSSIDFESHYCKSFKNGDVHEGLLELGTLPNDGFVPDHLPYKINDAKKHLDLMWLSIKVVMQARKEAALYRLSKYYRRNLVFSWSAAIAQELGSKRIAPYTLLFLMTPARELTDKGKAKLKGKETGSQHNTIAMAEDLLKFIKSLIGSNDFNKLYSKVQLHYTRKRIDRKKNEAIIRVKDQIRGVKRKKVKQLKDRVAKKRKSKSLI